MSMGKGLVFVAVLAVGAGIAWRFTVKAEAVARAAPSSEPPRLRVVTPAPAPDRVSLTLPGSLRPREHVTLFARTNGFLRQWTADLGDAVKKGQVLARIDGPELGANLAQTKARLAQAESSITLVRGQHERVTAMSKTGNLSPQDVDASALRLTAAESELATAKAEVDRLSALVGFQTVVAPFDGTVTKRYVDNGALVSAGVTALFEQASTQDLRLDVDVPQWVAAQIRPGTPAQVTIGRAAAAIEAKVERTAGALDPVLRTLGVQLTFATPPTDVVPGSYARVRFDVPRGEPALGLPGSALAVRNGATVVAVVGADHSIHYTPVRLVRDLGREVEIQGELPPGTQVALFPPASLSDGDKVTPVVAQAAPAAKAPSAGLPK